MRMEITILFAALVLLECTKAVDINSSAPLNGENTRRIIPGDIGWTPKKDVVLNLLETKLKEIKTIKKKKSKKNNSPAKCGGLPKDINLKLTANGISAVGQTDLSLNLKKRGNGSLKLDASGISNVGKANLYVVLGGSDLNIPGLGHVFSGKQKDCAESEESGYKSDEYYKRALNDEKILDNETAIEENNYTSPNLDIKPDLNTVPSDISSIAPYGPPQVLQNVPNVANNQTENISKPVQVSIMPPADLSPKPSPHAI